jgi:hypothetical protein
MMIVSDLVKVATQQFEQKMLEFGKDWDTQRLTAELAGQVRIALQQAFSHASRQAYKYFLEHYDLKEPLIEWQGRTLRFKAISTKTFLTSFGKIPVERSLYQADTGGASCVPLDHFWDMNGQFATEDVRQGVCLAMAHMTAEETEQLLQLCSLFRPSATAIKHIVENVCHQMQPHREILDTRIQSCIEPAEQTQVMVASMDGANVLLREQGAPRGRPSERPRQKPAEAKKATYKNAMVGAISFYGAVGDDQKGPERLRSYYSARMPEDRAVTFKRDFERHLDILQGKLDPRIVKVLLCDGHRALWKYADHRERFNDYEKLVDFYHSQEHLSKAAEALFGKNSVDGQRWYCKYRSKLLEQDAGAESVLRSMDYYGHCRRLSKGRRKALATERTFFRRNQHRMQYASFRRRGLAIGSGPVEAACKSIVKTRLCRSGMRWSREGGQRILDLRCYVKSGLWDEFWDAYKQLCRSA